MIEPGSNKQLLVISERLFEIKKLQNSLLTRWISVEFYFLILYFYVRAE